MAKLSNTFSVVYSDRLTVEYLYGSSPAELVSDEVLEIEKAVREAVRLDQASVYFPTARELIKNELTKKFGDGVRYVHYRSSHGKNWKLALYINTEFDPELVQRKLANHRDVLNMCLTTGTAFRVILPATPKTRKQVTHQYVSEIVKKGGAVTPFEYSDLEPLLRDQLLVQLCTEGRISLAGTQVTRITMKISEE